MGSTWEQRVRRAEEAVASWRPRLLDPDTPEPRTSLAKDDDTFPPMPCSQLAWWGLSVAVEHLDAGLRLLADQKARGGPYFTDANYTVLRAALLGASQAAVLLLPASREVRTTYGLQLAHEELRRTYNLRAHIRDHEGLPEDARAAASEARHLESIRGPLTRAASALEARKARKSFPDTDLVATAAELVHANGEDTGLLRLGQELEWRLASGSAHGQLLVTMHRTNGHETEGNRAKFAGDYDDIAQAVCRATLIASEAWRHWDLRRQHHRSE